MSDPHLTEFWAKADPPWNDLGPKIAAAVNRAARSEEPTRLVRWAQAVRKERLDRGMTQAQVAARIGAQDGDVSRAELAQPGQGAAIWTKLATFYWITLD
jgi:ribosome-binding protein aMBF1 (putative translation factor)